ncbi:MAG: hypothetical protein J5713_00465 [Clostridia bacterium]|nr:hypothetical protein [Clostridia bacterium]
MENCLIIINKSAGSSDKISFDTVKKTLGRNYRYACHTIPTDGEPTLSGYDALAVCGGDGTLSTVLEKVYDKQQDVFYFPYGTLNDKAKASHSKKQDEATNSVVGLVKAPNCQTVFSYVLAAGAFTPIGYSASVKMKKRFGALAYLAEVVKEYKVHRIRAKIVADGKEYEGEFALVMFIRSPRCFGFKFNKAYDEQSTSGHLVLIRSPKHDGLIGKIEMFFPFFRTFFMGLKKERDDKIVFQKFNNMTASFDLPTDFCKDGERATIEGDVTVEFVKTECHLSLMR